MRLATPDDTDAITDVLALAFRDDPTWSWAFPDRRLDDLRRWWSLFVRNAIPHGAVHLTPAGEAVALWIPPGAPELSDEDEALVEPLLRELIGDRADAVLDLMERFEDHHPRDRPHAYLSLLGTHPDHRGRGLGMGLVAESLAAFDAREIPAYLESSNPDNDRRYARLGFEQISELVVPGGGPTLHCMWREPR